MTLHLTEQDVAELLTMPDCIRAVEEAFQREDAGSVTNHPRRRLRPPKGVLHCMEACDLGLGRMGLKVYTSFRPRARFLVFLYDTDNGDLLALIEADRLGQMRTGAATGVATKYLAREDSRNLCLFGAGLQAETQALAISTVRKLHRVSVYSRTEEKRDEFARRLASRIGTEVNAESSVESALEGADIVVTATTSRNPVFDGALLVPGTHVNAIGSNSLARAEIDTTAVARADRVVVDSIAQSKLESGDLLGAVESNRLRWEKVVELREIAAGRRPGRESPGEITLFKSNGVALEDIAAASWVYDLAVERGAGRPINLFQSTVAIPM